MDEKPQGQVLELRLTPTGAALGVCQVGQATDAGGPRGRVSRFSRQSRRRMIDHLRRIEWREGQGRMAPQIHFLTLTYGQDWPDDETARNHLRVLFRRLEQRLFRAAFIWRIDWQTRGAPHFHVVVLSRSHRVRIGKRWLARNWGDIIGIEYWDYSDATISRTGSPQPPQVDWDYRPGAKGSISYVCKYVAHVEAGGVAAGPHAGASAPAAASGETASRQTVHIGRRRWGVEGRKNIRYGVTARFRVGGQLAAEGWLAESGAKTYGQDWIFASGTENLTNFFDLAREFLGEDCVDRILFVWNTLVPRYKGVRLESFAGLADNPGAREMP